MPAMYAHLRFGQEVRKLLPSHLNEMIQPFQAAFDIGLQGPDILFFYQPYKKNKISTLGSNLHKQYASHFLNNARPILALAHFKEAHAYILGFICHFILDSSCHGFVEEMIPYTKTDHYIIESEFEKYLLEKDHIIPQSYDYTKDIPTNKQLSNTISLFYDGLDGKEIQKALQAMHFYKGMLITKTKSKQNIYKGVMRLPALSNFKGLLLDFHTISSCKSSNQGLYIRYQQAIPLCVEMINAFEKSIQSNTPLPARFDKHFE